MEASQDGARDGAVVTAHEIQRRYGEGDAAVDALRGVSLDVEQGKLTAVMGPSGSWEVDPDAHPGGARPADQRLRHDRRHPAGQLSDKDITKIRREHIGFIFQFFNLLPMLTAEENILLPLSLAGKKPDKPFFQDLVKRVGLSRTGSRTGPPSSPAVSTQRVAIARALVSRPTVVFADEPTGNLDSKTQAARSSTSCTSRSRTTARRW